MAIVTENEIIDIAIRLEESGEAFYTAAAANTTVPELQKLFGELSTQERQHRRTLQHMGRNEVKLALTPGQWAEFQAYVGALLQQNFFAGTDRALAQAASATDQPSALQAAINFEKESILFYEELRSAVHETDRQIVARIIHEEQHHLQRLADVLAGLNGS